MMGQLKYCKNCGYPLEAGVRNCPECGTEVDTQTSQTPPTPPAPPTPTPPTPQPLAEPGGSKKNNSLMITIIILLALLVVGVVVGVVLLVKDDSKPEDTEIVAAPEIDPAALADTTGPATVTIDEPNAAETAAPRSDYGYVVEGKIGKYGIVMEISIGSSITGRYRYKSQKGAGGWLSLSGYTSGNTFGMSEFDNKDDNTGNFEGTYSITGNKLTMNGTMYNAKGQSFRFVASGTAAE